MTWPAQKISGKKRHDAARWNHARREDLVTISKVAGFILAIWKKIYPTNFKLYRMYVEALL